MSKRKKEVEEIIEKIIEADFKETMEQSYIDYSIEVITERALPDIRDGLKPVQRKSIYTFEELGITKDKPYKKSARLVGETMGKYHPHGDSSIYEAIVRMTQPFMLNYPLIDGHGNWGSIDGDSAAAMRYSECRLEKISNELIDGLKSGTVKFVPNFDEEETEPLVLPARFPNLLVNGTEGIAVGLVSSIPTHNLRDTINMIIHYMKKSSKKGVNTAELLDILKGPDFPTGGIVTNVEELLDVYKTGEGKISIRAKLVEENINGKPCLIVTEIPYTYSGRKASLVDKISKVILSKKIDELVEIKDESSKEGIRIVIECKKGSDLEKVANKLYKFTPLQDSMVVRFNGTIGKELIPFNLIDYCKYFTDFQEEIYTKEYVTKKAKLDKKKEIYEGLVKSIDFIDTIIDLIRHAEKVEFAKRCLMTGNVNNIKFALKKNEQIAKKFSFTELQAEAILETTLRKLNTLEVETLINTLKEIEDEIAFCNKILSSKEELHKVIINRLTKIAKEYGRDRLTELKNATIIEYEEEVKVYETNVVYDKYGYIKMFDEKTIGKVDDVTFENCKLNKKTDSTDILWAFSNEGSMYQIKLSSLPFNKQNDRGTLLEVKVGKKIDGDIIYVTTQNSEGKLIFVTEKGFIKIVDKQEFISTRTITNSTKLSPDDKILKIIEINDEDSIIATTDTNYLNFSISEISELKKTSVGVVSIKVPENVKIKDVVTYKKETTEEIILNNKPFKVAELKVQKRGSKGTKF